MSSSRGFGDVVCPYGNEARAKVVGHAENGKVIVQFLTPCIAKFSWFSLLIFEKGHRMEISPEHLHDRPKERESMLFVGGTASAYFNTERPEEG